MELTDKKYKESEVGLIPINWEVKTLGACLTRNPDYGINAPAVPYSDSLPTYIRITDISDDGRFNKSGKVSVNDIQSSNFYLEVGDIVLARTGASVGKSYCYDSNDGALVFAGFLIRIKPDQDFLNPKYLKFFLQSNFYLNWVKENSMRSGQPGINSNEYSRLPIPIPSKSEQTAIATALSDTDALIENLEKLIAKKRSIKQGMMQELLTGRKRLAWFNGSWKEKKLGDIGKTYGGLSGKSKIDFEDGKYPYIPFLNILNNPIIDCNFFDYVNLSTEEKQNKAYKGDLFFNGSSETPEEVGMCSVLLDSIPNLYLNSFCFGFRLFSEKLSNGMFLSYYFRSKVGRKLIYSLAQGATRYNLSKTNFLKLVIRIPEPEEQEAIANVLVLIDREIQTLEQKLYKYQLIKQGMMQALLTGKIRLV